MLGLLWGDVKCTSIARPSPQDVESTTLPWKCFEISNIFGFKIWIKFTVWHIWNRMSLTALWHQFLSPATLGIVERIIFLQDGQSETFELIETRVCLQKKIEWINHPPTTLLELCRNRTSPYFSIWRFKNYICSKWSRKLLHIHSSIKMTSAFFEM